MDSYKVEREGREGGRERESEREHCLPRVTDCFQDLMFARRTFENGEEIRKLYLLHALNHILKTRSRILKNNTKLTLASKEGKQIE